MGTRFVGWNKNQVGAGANGTLWQKVTQFLSEGRYVANVVDGKATLYRK
jgi:hypothetical protein